jgi:hypothetical protein
MSVSIALAGLQVSFRCVTLLFSKIGDEVARLAALCSLWEWVPRSEDLR